MKYSDKFLHLRRHAIELLWELVAGEKQFLVVQSVPATSHAALRMGVENFVAVSRNSPATDLKNFFLPRAWFDGMRAITDRLKSLTTIKDDQISLFEAELSDSSTQATHIVLTLWSALKSHFPNQFEWAHEKKSLVASVVYWLPSCGDDQFFIPFLKYQLSYLFARGEQQTELPVRPNNLYHKDGILLLGSIGSHFRSKTLTKKEKPSRKAWRNTVLHGIKKGLPQMGPSLLAKNADAMKKRLTSAASSPDSALKEIRRTAREIYGKGITEKSWNKPAKAWTGLSGNACYENSKSNAGAIGLLREKDCAVNRLGFDQLRSIAYFPRKGVTKDVYFPSWTYESIYDQCRRESLKNLDIPGKAEVSLIREPLKARAISAGDLNSNCLFSDLQKKMWKRLQAFKQFELTGRWVSEDDLMDIDREAFYLDDDLDHWVSGDYSAATDSLHSDATEAAIQFVGGDELTRSVLRRGLTNTEICFDKLRKQGIDAPENFVMTRGQLMGCVFSFPILCLINIAMYRAALEERLGRRFRLSELPVRVNGDDILFKADQSLYSIWQDWIRRVGFEKSVGKNYFSKDFAIINSVYFDTSLGIKPVPYLNLGWCTGVSKGSDDSEKKDLFRIRQQMDDLEKYGNGYPGFDRVIRQFKNQVFEWNKRQILASHLPLDKGPMGLNLADDYEADEKIDRFRYWVIDSLDPKPQHGLKAYPKTMSPWKVTTTENCHVSYSKLWVEFCKFESTKPIWAELPFHPRTTKTCRDRLLGDLRYGAVVRHIQSEIRSGLKEFEEEKCSLGAL